VPLLGDTRERAAIGSDAKRDTNAVSVELGEARRRPIKRFEKICGRLVRPWIRLYDLAAAACSLFAHAADSSLLICLSAASAAF
jgi:hypothetical protein